jgi:hypothetical protein
MMKLQRLSYVIQPKIKQYELWLQYISGEKKNVINMMQIYHSIQKDCVL